MNFRNFGRLPLSHHLSQFLPGLRLVWGQGQHGTQVLFRRLVVAGHAQQYVRPFLWALNEFLLEIL